MVSNGHAWSSIKNYTLSEIGIFYKTIVLKERDKIADDLLYQWISTNSTKKSILETIDYIQGKSSVKKDTAQNLSKDEVKSEWVRLKNFMSGRK